MTAEEEHDPEIMPPPKTQQDAVKELPSPDERPKPNGLGGGLLLFCLLAMVVAPLAGFSGIVQLISLAADIPAFIPEQAAAKFALFYKLNAVFSAVLAGLVFCTGYIVYAGSPDGRKTVIAFFLFMTVGRLLLPAVLPDDDPRIQEAATRQSAYGLIFPMLWLVYFAAGRRPRNTYNPAYRHIPIRRKPIARLERIAWLGWGGLVTLAASATALAVLSAPDGQSTERTATAAGTAAPIPEFHAVTADGTTLRIPTPRHTVNAREVDLPTGDFTLNIFFSARTPQGFVEYIVCSVNVNNEASADWDGDKFAAYRDVFIENLKQLNLDQETLANEPNLMTVRLTQDVGTGGEQSKFAVVESYLLVKKRLIRLSAATVAFNVQGAAALDGLLREWRNQVVKENGE